MSERIIQELKTLLEGRKIEDEETNNSVITTNPMDFVREGLSQIACNRPIDVVWVMDQSWKEVSHFSFKTGLEYAQISLDYIWEKLNTGYWKDIDKRWREMYTIASLLKVFCLIGNESQIAEVFKSCDMGLLMGAPVLDNILSKVADVLNKEYSKGYKEELDVGSTDIPLWKGKKRKFQRKEWPVSDDNIKAHGGMRGQSFIETRQVPLDSLDDKSYLNMDKTSNAGLNEISTRPGQDSVVLDRKGCTLKNYNHKEDLTTTNQSKNLIVLNKDKCIPREKSLSLETFQLSQMKASNPVIIENMMDHWPAMSNRRWGVQYLRETAGCRTVPIEIGSRYTSDDWTQKLLPIKEFIDRFIDDRNSDQKGYLAQHQLFDQIPELRADISIPDYCCLGDDVEMDEDVIINAWFGPAGTVSPLHQDPYHNIFAQVVGQKYIRLYNKDCSDMVYPHVSTLLDNTSQVDVENPDLEKFPLFAEAPYLECILNEGEMLYIPKKCWHYVRSLSLSFSVSFWWS